MPSQFAMEIGGRTQGSTTMWNNDRHSARLAERADTALVTARAEGGARVPVRRTSGHSVVLAGKADAIGALAVFDDCGDDGRTQLAEASTLRRLRRGASLDPQLVNAHLVAVVRGFVRTSIARDDLDRELILDVFGNGDVVSDWCWGSSDLAGGGAVVALEDSVLLLSPRRALERMLLAETGASIRFLHVLAGAGARAVALATQNACLAMGDRLYCRLVELAHRRGRSTAQGLLVEHGLAQWELAAFTSASRENVNRQLNEWRARGWIELQRRAFVLRDAEALSQAVSPTARRVGFGAGNGRLPLPSAAAE